MAVYAVVAILLVGMAAGLAAYEGMCAVSGTKTMQRSAVSATLESEASGSQRAKAQRDGLAAALARASGAIESFAPMTRDEAGSVRERLRRAGMTMEPETWRALMVLVVMGGPILAAVVCIAFGVPGLWLALSAMGAGGAGYIAMDRLLTVRQRNRRQAIEASLPDAMELLAVALAAGSPVEQCFREVSGSLHGPISEELRLVDQEVNLLGHTRTEALEHFAKRCASQEVTAFVGQITQSLDQGSSVVDGLAAQALLAREQAQAAALERIRKMPTKLDVVLSACFLPPTVIMVLVPTVVKLLAFLNGGMV